MYNTQHANKNYRARPKTGPSNKKVQEEKDNETETTSDPDSTGIK